MALSLLSSPRRFMDEVDAPSSITISEGLPAIELADFYINNLTNNIWLCVNAGSIVNKDQSGIVWQLMKSIISSGSVNLVLGTATVLTSSVTVSSKITLSSAGPSGTVGSWRVSAIVPGISFTIISSSALDTSIVYWEIS